MFLTFELRFIILFCWMESVDPVADLRLKNQIYSVLLNGFEFKEITYVQNAHLKMLLEDDETRTRRCKTFNCSEVLLEDGEAKGDVTPPRGCKYPTPPGAPAKRDPLVSSNRECFAHYRHISYFFNKSSLSLYVYTRGILGCLLGFWPRGQDPAGANTTYNCRTVQSIVNSFVNDK